MCRTYSFHNFVLEELDVGEEDGRRDPEDLHSSGFKDLIRGSRRRKPGSSKDWPIVLPFI